MLLTIIKLPTLVSEIHLGIEIQLNRFLEKNLEMETGPHFNIPYLTKPECIIALTTGAFPGDKFVFIAQSK